jgi:hypothetical protein
LHRGLQSSSHCANVSDTGSDAPSIHLKLHSLARRAPSSKVDSYSDMSRGHQCSSCSASASDVSSNAPSTHIKLWTPGSWHKAQNSNATKARRAAHSSDRYMAKPGAAQRQDASRRSAASRRGHSSGASFAEAVDCLSLQMGISDTCKGDTDAVLTWARFRECMLPIDALQESNRVPYERMQSTIALGCDSKFGLFLPRSWKAGPLRPARRS